MDFKYIAKGQLQHDFCTIDYYNGTSWATLQTIAPTVNSGCAGQGKWAAYSTYTLPASANNNANVKIGFNWVNDDDGVGTDPSIAVDSVRLSYSSLDGIDNINFGDNSISVYPTPNNGNFTLAYHLQLGIRNYELGIFDITGRKVYSTSIIGTDGTQSIDASVLNNGIYYWEVISSNGVSSKGRIAIVK